MSDDRGLELKLASATRDSERAFLAETITDWMRIHPEYEVFK